MGQMSLMISAFDWEVPGADSEARIRERVVYLGGVSRKHWPGAGSESGRAGEQFRACSQACWSGGQLESTLTDKAWEVEPMKCG